MPIPEIALKVILSALAFLFLAAFSLLFILLSGRLLRARADRRHNIHLENRGNCRSVYTLAISADEPALRFSFFIQGTPLVEIQAEKPENLPPSAAAQTNPPANLRAPAPAKTAAPSLNAETAIQGGQKAASRAGVAASLLGALGQLLPGSLGAGLRAQSAQARKIQTSTSRAVQAPQTFQNQVGVIQKESGKLTGAKPGETSPPARESRPLTLTRPSGSSLASSASLAAPANGACLVQTPELSPGHSLDLTLVIGTTQKRYPAGSFAYTLESRPFCLDFPEARSAPVRRQGIVHFAKIGAWRYWLPVLVNLVIFLAGMAILIVLVTRIWQFNFSGILYG